MTSPTKSSLSPQSFLPFTDSAHDSSHAIPVLREDAQAASLRVQLASYEAQFAQRDALLTNLEAELAAAKERLESDGLALERATAYAQVAEDKCNNSTKAGEKRLRDLQQTWETRVHVDQAQSAWKTTQETALAEKDALAAEREALIAALGSLQLIDALLVDKCS